MKLSTAELFVVAFGIATVQQIESALIAAGPTLELMHLYYDQWPTGTL